MTLLPWALCRSRHAMHAAVGNVNWFSNERRAEQIAAGFAEGCRLAGAVWGAGETPVLKDIVGADTIVLAGSAVSSIATKNHRIKGNVNDGDAIIFLASSGVHANGITLCRSVAAEAPNGYSTKLSNGLSLGESILAPTAIYVRFMRALLQENIVPHYAVNITGHGWRKLMRLKEPFVYQIEHVPPAAPVFRFLIDSAGLSLREAYATFNMGVGFAVFVDQKDANRCIEASRSSGFDAWVAGVIRKQGERKAVEIVPHDIVFEEDTLRVRA